MDKLSALHHAVVELTLRALASWRRNHGELDRCATPFATRAGQCRRLENGRREELPRARVAEVAPFFPRGIAPPKQ